MKKILLVGASGAIGSAILKELYSEYIIYATSTSQEKLTNLISQFPKIIPIIYDQTQKKEKELIQQIENIDGIIVASGITCDKLCARLSDADWEKTLEINLSSIFRIIKNAYIKLNKESSIVLISSVVARMGNIGQVAYAASKGGLEAKTLAKEFASKQITINSIAPGFIESEMISKLNKEEIIKNIPLKRIGLPEEVAFAASFLMSNRAKYITGHTLEINGGLWMI